MDSLLHLGLTTIRPQADTAVPMRYGSYTNGIKP